MSVCQVTSLEMMTPIERTRAKAEALNTLGLSLYATPADVRLAWRQIAFNKHPDCGDDSQVEFTAAKAAYDFLRDEMGAALPDAGHGTSNGLAGTRVRRPEITTRTEALPPETVAHCRALLAAPAEATEAGSVAAHERPAKSAADHVPTFVERRGRHLTYVVATPLARGRNRVAMPTALLEGTRRHEPTIVSFLSSEAGPGQYRLPDSGSARLFRGARSVTIRFGSV